MGSAADPARNRALSTTSLAALVPREAYSRLGTPQSDEHRPRGGQGCAQSEGHVHRDRK